MAIHTGFHSSRIKKSAGGITYSNWKGIPVAKQKATQVANPRTPKQIAQRARFKATSLLAKSLLPAIKIGFSNLAVKRSEYNVFVTKNIQNVIGASDGTVNIDIASVQISEGSLATLVGITGVTATAVKASFIWSLANTPNAAPDDMVVAVAWNETQQTFAGFSNEMTRDEEGLELVHEEVQTGDVIHYWAFAWNDQTNEVSNSIYISSSTIA